MKDLDRDEKAAEGQRQRPGLADLPADFTDEALELSDSGAHATLDSIKRSAMLQAIDRFHGNRTRAAAYLGISVRTLQRKLREWGLAGPSPG